MASSSASSSSQTKRYGVFTSFHGPDVRQGFLSHLHTHFESRGITTFHDQEMERGHTIGPKLVQAIRESRVWIVVLSKKYASSRWCLDELVEIFKCKGDQGQNVIPIFYKVHPSDVRKQSGDFGKAFEETCQGQSKEVKERWSEALADVAIIAGEHSLRWANEAKMIEKISTDVSKKLNVTPSQIKRYSVFTNFHGPDVRQGFLSHLHTHFESRGITTFNDQDIVRGHTIGRELIDAIRESRVWIVVLSEKYASSSWCLGELVEIFNCNGDQGQNVFPIFYKVDPSDVKKQRGDFGKAFEKTSEGKSKEVKERWAKALADVATIAGEHTLNWDNEAEMIQKIAKDVLDKQIHKVGLEAHLTEMNSLLDLESNDVKMIGIWGPAGIGKSTIAESLYSQISSRFKLKCFMEILKGTYKSIESRLALQSRLLYKILNQKDMKIDNLGAIKERLQDQRVLIILDDVDDLEQLEVLAKELSWFGSGSRIIVTTEDKRILKAHGINDVYHVDFPSKEDALEIFCRSAFRQSFVPDGFEELANKVVQFCGKLPLGLSVVGSSLRGESKHEWELQLSEIETTLDKDIEDMLRVGYDRLKKKDQSLFLHIACLFNNDSVEHVSSLLADSHDVEIGLKNLAEKSLVHTNGNIVMHYLLQKLGKQIVRDQSDEPGKRQFLLEFKEIRDVLTKETGTGSVLGISLDTYTIGKDDHIYVGKLGLKRRR